MSALFDHYRQKENRLSHVKNLITLAAVDGNIDKAEIELITTIAVRMGLSSTEIANIIRNPASIKFKAPDSIKDKISQLTDMVYVMMIDMEIHKNEYAFCKLMAAAMGFKGEIIDAIFLSILSSVEEGLDSEEAKRRAERVVG